eukprot:1717783-Pleurochrysis_carterae.AAC.1
MLSCEVRKLRIDRQREKVAERGKRQQTMDKREAKVGGVWIGELECVCAGRCAAAENGCSRAHDLTRTF